MAFRCSRWWGPLAAAGLLAATGCGDSRPAARAGAAADRAAPLTDDFGDTIRSGGARRIVSLNPTTTEILFAIGAGSRVVGRTRWDLWPDSARFVPDLGDGIRPNVEAILAARPNLVVLYASNDNRAAARRLREAGIATLAVKVDLIRDFQRVVRLLGRSTGDTVAARVLEDTVMTSLAIIRRSTEGLERPRVFWVMWESPLLTIGGGSYLTELVDIAGGRNVYDSLPQPSPAVTIEDVVRREPDIVLVSPEGARSIRRAPSWRALRAVREGRILVVDTALVFRPSVRLGEAARSLATLLHPEARR